MTMQQALQQALAADAFARPEHNPHYTYRYHCHGKGHLIHVYGRDRFGVLKNDFWRTMSRKEVEAEWMLCDQDGAPYRPSLSIGLTLKDLVA